MRAPAPLRLFPASSSPTRQHTGAPPKIDRPKAQGPLPIPCKQEAATPKQELNLGIQPAKPQQPWHVATEQAGSRSPPPSLVVTSPRPGHAAAYWTPHRPSLSAAKSKPETKCRTRSRLGLQPQY